MMKLADWWTATGANAPSFPFNFSEIRETVCIQRTASSPRCSRARGPSLLPHLCPPVGLLRKPLEVPALGVSMFPLWCYDF